MLSIDWSLSKFYLQTYHLHIQPLIPTVVCPLGHLNFLTSANDSKPRNGPQVLSLHTWTYPLASPICTEPIHLSLSPHQPHWVSALLSLTQDTLTTLIFYLILLFFLCFPLLHSPSTWQLERYWDSDLIRPLIKGSPLQKVKLHTVAAKPLCDPAPADLSCPSSCQVFFIQFFKLSRIFPATDTLQMERNALHLCLINIWSVWDGESQFKNKPQEKLK